MQAIKVGRIWLEDATVAALEKADVRLALVQERAHRFDGSADVTASYLRSFGLPAEVVDIGVDSEPK